MTTNPTGRVAVPTQERTIFGHPPGLYVLFLTEMWERFSFYGMRALLVLYMTNYLLKKDINSLVGMQSLKHFMEGLYGPLDIQPFASSIYGTYNFLVYTTPIFGGILADRLWGQKRTVVIGGLLMAAGHFMMAFEDQFLVALSLIILGNGCFKPNVSTQVGSLYAPEDPRRDRAYVIYYMGINLGAMFSPLVCGALGQKFGWHYGFTAAGVGMVLGLLLYMRGQSLLSSDEIQARKERAQTDQPLTSNEWKAIGGFILLCFLNVIFWVVYEQQGNTLQLFADRNTDWHIFGWEMPSTWLQAMNPAFILMMGPLLNMFWQWQSTKKKEPTSVSKMAIGCVVLGFAFVVLYPITANLGPDDRISFLWLVLMSFISTIGELYVSPVGLSVATKVAPARMLGLMMGLWFFFTALGSYFSGYIGMFYEQMSKQSFFALLTGLAILAGFAIFALNRPLKKAIGNI